MPRATLVVIVLILLGTFYLALGHRSAPPSNGHLPDPVLSDVLTPQNADRIFHEVRDGRLPLDQRLLFARAMARVGFSPTAFAGKTVGGVIAEQRAREKAKAGPARGRKQSRS